MFGFCFANRFKLGFDDDLSLSSSLDACVIYVFSFSLSLLCYVTGIFLLKNKK